MRIAQVAPLTEAIPPKLYGGTERVVYWLIEELVALGHNVTLFASGDSCTSAKLEAFWPRAFYRSARTVGELRRASYDLGVELAANAESSLVLQLARPDRRLGAPSSPGLRQTLGLIAGRLLKLPPPFAHAGAGAQARNSLLFFRRELERAASVTRTP